MLEDKGAGDNSLAGWLSALVLALVSAIQHLVYKKKKWPNSEEILSRLSTLEDSHREESARTSRAITNIFVEMERMEDRLTAKIKRGSTGD